MKRNIFKPELLRKIVIYLFIVPIFCPLCFTLIFLFSFRPGFYLDRVIQLQRREMKKKHKDWFQHEPFSNSSNSSSSSKTETAFCVVCGCVAAGCAAFVLSAMVLCKMRINEMFEVVVYICALDGN